MVCPGIAGRNRACRRGQAQDHPPSLTRWQAGGLQATGAPLGGQAQGAVVVTGSGRRQMARIDWDRGSTCRSSGKLNVLV